MYDDILGEEKENEKEKENSINWDFSKYVDEAYCYKCGSTNIETLKDKLTKDLLIRKVRCKTCYTEWKEVWNKDIDLELEKIIAEMKG
jgi:hypothetical protein